MKRQRLAHSVAVLAVALAMATAPSAVKAMDTFPCATAEDAQAFNLRHLQSRFMVAALACNQQDAYNKFVIQFRPHLMDAGGRLTGYFNRAGGGQPDINKHVTELANAAGLLRAEDPTAYCTGAWALFWVLEQTPLELAAIAEANAIGSVPRPSVCAAAHSGNIAAAETAAPAAQ